MAKPWARAFYNSKQWVRVRGFAFKRDFGLCTKCGRPGEEVHHIKRLTPENISDPNIALALSNLTTLCRDCHFEAHKQDRVKDKEVTREGLIFNEKGELVLSS